MGGQLLADIGLGGGDRPAHQAVREEVAGLDEGGGGQAHRHIDDAIFHQPIIGDDDHQGAAGPKMDEFNVTQGTFGLGRHHKSGATRQAGQRIGRLFKDLGHAAPAGSALPVDRFPLRGTEPTDLQQAMDEQAHAQLGGQASGRRMGGIKQPRLFEIGHDVANRGGGQGHAQAVTIWRKISRERSLSSRKPAEGVVNMFMGL